MTPPGSREYVFGRTRTGKSAYMDWEDITISQERPDAMQVVVDTKPRYRAETERMPINVRGRRSAAWRYRNWQKGPTLPNSVVCDIHSAHPFRGLWSRPGEIVIMQGGDAKDWMRMLVLLDAFTKAQIGGRERRVRVDEVLDFYQRNTWGISPKKDVFYRTARAGGERNIGLSLGAHQVSGNPPLILKMCNVFVLFHLASNADMKGLQAVGVRDAESPEGDYVFRRYEVAPGGRMSDPFEGTCSYPDWYLDQLASV